MTPLHQQERRLSKAGRADVAEIARTLSKAQREAFLRSDPDKMHADHAGRISTYGDMAVGYELYTLGLTKRPGTFSLATPLGLALRTHILTEEQQP